MIRVVDRHNRDFYTRSMDQHFQLRHEVFVRECGWKEFEREGGQERDQYDDDNATYLLCVDDSDDVVGCVRLYPTALPHMLCEQFPYLIDGAPLQRSDVFEVSRISIVKDKRGSQIYYELFLGMQEYCLDHGLAGLTCVIRTFRIPVVQKLGIPVMPLGLSKEIGGEMCTGVFFEFDEGSLMRTRKAASIVGTVMEDHLPARKIA